MTPAKPLPEPDSPSAPLPISSARGIKWGWLLAFGLAAIAMAFLGTERISILRVSHPISLALIERDGQLRIEWDRATRLVTNATSGSLRIIDGGETQMIALSASDLSLGELTYQRKSGDVEVRLSVQEAAGRKVEEASRFLGSAPAKAIDPAELVSLQQRESLEGEVERLRRENSAQAERIREFETAMRILEERLQSSGR